MFFKTPDKGSLTDLNGTGRWEAPYSMLIGGEMHTASVTILYLLPNFEILEVNVEAAEELKEHRMYDYAGQMVTQQGVAEFLDWTVTQKKHKPQKFSDDPLFER